MLEKEISKAILDLKIKDKVKVFTGDEKNSILSKLQKIFVVGNPRVWWLSLKYKPISYVFEQKEQYKKIADFFDKEEEVWFVVEDEFNNNEQLLYKMKITYVIDIIGECMGFEYNIISEDYNRFLCETDHDEFLFIDINKNQLKE